MEYAYRERHAVQAGGVTFDTVFFDEADSTSSYIKRQLLGGGIRALPVAATATVQSAGRGRLCNRSFFSPRGGTYLSCAFSESQILCGIDSLTFAAGVATAQAIESLCDCRITLKWVNDLLLDGKKVGGILSESMQCEQFSERVYIIGIGVNSDPVALRDFMPQKVGALPTAVPAESLRAAMLEQLAKTVSLPVEDIVRAYNARLTVCGKRVLLVRQGKREEVTVLRATTEGLVCLTDGGQTHVVRSCDEILSDLYAIEQAD